jgi:ectoine hydroxylase-related dioxygenase (phytanoyl-CoA dioxygenase family)
MTSSSQHRQAGGSTAVSVVPLGSSHHGDLCEVVIDRGDRIESAERLTVVVDGVDEQWIDAPAGQRQVAGLLAGHLLTEGASALTLARESSVRRATIGEVELQVPTPTELHAAVAGSLRSSNHRLLSQQPMDSTQLDYADTSLTPWFDRADARAIVQKRARVGDISGKRATQLDAFVSDGFLVIENALDVEELAAATAAVDDIVATSFGGYSWGSSQRVEHAHRHYPAMATVTRASKVLDFLQDLFVAEPKVCQTLTYIFGSQQGSHQDTIHLTPFPAGYMCGVWIALEDIQPGSGELAYYPGSHRLERVYMDSVGCPKVENGDWSTFAKTVVPRWEGMLLDGGFEQRRFLPKAGTALIWHENLMHRGLPRVDMSLSRRSVVTHYFASGTVGYYDSTGLPAKFAHAITPNH